MAAMDDGRATTRRLEATRRTNRGHRRDWLEASYEIEVRAIFVAIAVFGLPALLSGDVLTHSELVRFRDHAPGIVSLLLAFAVWAALRSGTHGAPLAPEAPDVTYLLLAPLPRSFVLRRLARQQVRVVVLVGAVCGTAVGVAASERLPGTAVGWVLSDLAAGVGVAVLLWGAVAASSARRLSATTVNIIAALLVALAVVDVARRTWIAPTTWVASMGLVPLRGLVPTAAVVAGAVAAVALPAFALWSVGGSSLELLARRSALVSQLRFAASLEDVRTVVLLHRELAMEQGRRRPWIRLRAGDATRRPAWRRGWHSYARWPAGRVGRVVLLLAAAVAAAIAARTTPLLVVVAGLASFVVALELIEPFAAELDHPTSLLTYGVAITELLRRNLAAPIATLVGVALAVATAASIIAPAHAALAFAVALSASLGALAGSALNVSLGPPSLDQMLSASAMPIPELAGLPLLFRQAIPPALAAAGLAPIAVAAASTTGDSSAIGLATAVAGASVATLVYCCERGV
jgi:hypothetical protein